MPECSTQTLTPSVLIDQTYTASFSRLDYVISAFTSPCSTCFTMCPIVYSLSLSDDSSYDPSLITFDPSTLTVSIFTNSASKSGSYTLKVSAYFTGQSMPYSSSTFLLTIGVSCAVETV